ncbi:MAG: glycosyltransferase family 4 protein [Planctomycetes bacterium]|nr:glycosyltransferase family 4 protein [Planctomycetota bacterium]
MDPHGCAILLAHGDRLEDLERAGQTDFLARIVRAYAEAFGEVTVFSYGANDDALASHYAPARIVHAARSGRMGSLQAALGWGLGGALRGIAHIEVRAVSGMLPALLVWGRPRAPVSLLCGFDWRSHWLRGSPMRFARGWAQRRVASLIERFGFGRADIVMASTERIERALLDRHPRLLGRTVVQPHPVDLSLIPAKREYRLGEPPSLLFVGRLAPQKNLEVLLEAVALLGCPVRLDLAGDGPLRGSLESLARARGVNARFLGVVPVESLYGRYATYDAFVFPTLYEGFPKALAEALAAGLPVVASDVEGNADLVADGRTGLLAPPAVEGIADALRRLLADEALREGLGRSARAAAARYDWNAVMGLRLARLKALAPGAAR